MKTGECHLINEPAPSDLASMQSNQKLKVLKGPGFNVGYLAMNVKKALSKNLLVRKAINLALNKKVLYKSDLYGECDSCKKPSSTLYGPIMKRQIHIPLQFEKG